MSKKINRFNCTCCGIDKHERDFYASQTYIYEHTGKLPVCKQCIWKYVIKEDDDYDIERMKDILQMLDKPMKHDLLEASDEEAKRDNKNTFKVYMKNLGLRQNRHLRWKDSDVANIKNTNHADKKENIKISNEKSSKEPSESDIKNREDVLRMLGYDPFETESEEDKIYLSNRLVDFLDESTLEDSFKLPAVIEIIKSFNQIDKLNHAISKIISDVGSVQSNSGSIKSLMDTKNNILKTVLKLAEDNAISVKHSTNKSKGAGTLTGIIKKLQEIGFEEADVNAFDIDTSEGMRQVADLSNESIIKQLQFDENDYTEMIIEQRELINELNQKAERLEEELRLLKKEKMKNM